MFIEPNFHRNDLLSHSGWIEVICGSMFSGKTEELLRRLNRARIAKQKLEIFKPAIDKRYHDIDIVSHDAHSIRSTPVYSPQEILLLAGSSEVVGIDEAQFFDDTLVEVCLMLANQHKRVIVAGLDMDFEGKPFGAMPDLMAVAEFVTKVHAICAICGSPANYSYRLTPDKSKVLLGETDKYEARCRKCFQLSEKIFS
ncbi:MAG: thymidine kinase [Verrucomicrobia bacterium]|nr:thymidine kinase [Cytophagales bacterium]